MGWALDPDLACIPAGIEFVVTQLKSMVLTLGLIDRHLTVEQAVLLSRLEEEYQVRQPAARGGVPQGLTSPLLSLTQINWGWELAHLKCSYVDLAFCHFHVHPEVKTKGR